MTLTEAIEFGMPCVNLAQDAEWCEVALETMKKYQNLISDDDWKEDAISRQAVDELSKALVHTTRDKADFLCNFWEGLRKLPPVNPQEPCSNCCNGNQIEQAKLCQKSYLAGMKHKQEPKWIPVSERLPKAGESNEYVEDVERYYLVQNEYGDMLVARYTRGEYWEQMYQLKPIDDEIVAWMPLPEPYTADKVAEDALQ